MSDEASWDARYAESDRIWSGQPNVVLVREVADETPGRALDLGCGEGADAVWLASRGWRVTAVDISSVALQRAAQHAADAGVADRVDWRHLDLGSGFPDGTYDLVSAQFLHSHGDMPRERILRDAAAAVAPGGILLIEGHLDPGPFHHRAHPEMELPSPDEVIAGLALADGEWEVLRSEAHERKQTGPDGEPAIRSDATVKVRRLPS
ncbi:class I SAM-dependent methyltransferase [Mangrovihabitans endophyticus]|uniref:Methyltransferase n=1 Tax=Mangrovihabitans endophyticus TaxID=1751298 RepID=A0A8J3C5T5_9ACTN|nr:class I SAM-dependent methyltransferase [Mangrovihabitans endophyticus]GGL12416.1 methyltransferase [Mangrovihabitans endophyticus]